MITLSKITDNTPLTMIPTPNPYRVRRPWYPLMAHRRPLRDNHLTALQSALWVLALEGGTAHLSANLTPSTEV